MPRGAPDWFSVVKPTYLEAEVVSGQETVSPAGGYDVCDVDGRGAVLCGQIWWSESTTRKEGQVVLKVDTVTLDNKKANELLDWDRYTPEHGPLFLLRYDDDNFQYVVGLTPKITFERNLLVQVVNPYGGVDIGFNWRIIYMLAR